jgi:hypothetical protein
VFLKSKKTATDIKVQTYAGTPLIRGFAGVLLFLFVLTTSLPACDMSSFVQSEFAERCQLLLDLCEKADLARNLGHPDLTDYNNALSREWIRFFLAHGNHVNIPPTLSFIATDSWNAAIDEVGNAIAGLIKTGLERERMNRLRFRVILMKEPQRIESLQKMFAGRRQFIDSKEIGPDKEKWLEQALILPAIALNDQLGENPELQHQLQTEVSSHIETLQRILEHEKQGSDKEVVAALFASLQQEINFDMAFWESLFFYNT